MLYQRSIPYGDGSAFPVSSFRTKRTGVLAMKIGVVPQWTKTGKKFLTTMFQVGKSVAENYLLRVPIDMEDSWNFMLDLEFLA